MAELGWSEKSSIVTYRARMEKEGRDKSLAVTIKAWSNSNNCHCTTLHTEENNHTVTSVLGKNCIDRWKNIITPIIRQQPCHPSKWELCSDGRVWHLISDDLCVFHFLWVEMFSLTVRVWRPRIHHICFPGTQPNTHTHAHTRVTHTVFSD